MFETIYVGTEQQLQIHRRALLSNRGHWSVVHPAPLGRLVDWGGHASVFCTEAPAGARHIVYLSGGPYEVPS